MFRLPLKTEAEDFRKEKKLYRCFLDALNGFGINVFLDTFSMLLLCIFDLFML